MVFFSGAKSHKFDYCPAALQEPRTNSQQQQAGISQRQHSIGFQLQSPLMYHLRPQQPTLYCGLHYNLRPTASLTLFIMIKWYTTRRSCLKDAEYPKIEYEILAAKALGYRFVSARRGEEDCGGITCKYYLTIVSPLQIPLKRLSCSRDALEGSTDPSEAKEGPMLSSNHPTS